MYIGALGWCVAWTLWGIIVAHLLKIVGASATFLAGPTILRPRTAFVEIEIKCVPWPCSSIRYVPEEDSPEIFEGGQGPFYDRLSLPTRVAILLVPFILLALVLATRKAGLTHVVTDFEKLLRGALSPITVGAPLAKGFLKRLGEAPLGDALTMILGKVLAVQLLPFGSLWSSLLYAVKPPSHAEKTGTAIFTFTQLLGLGIILSWLIAIAKALFF